MSTWRDDLNYGLAAFGVQIPERVAMDEWAASLANKPFENTAKLVAVSAALFYIAERGYNPKVTSIYDALVYCSTCLSVGYADVFARTPVGKLIGTFLMTIGPSIAAKTTDGPGGEKSAVVQEQILSTLRDIAAKLLATSPA